MRPSVSYKEGLLEDLKDPKEAVAYLDAALEEGDSERGGSNSRCPGS